ncbi:MAG: DUF5655 domain-containing protein [Reichenbachiella sp.]|uniref:DUF5655 domain-containing protein n=1 Tax=Reichenbachiella sp. TaxID=2184521 RepID=UPI003265F60F
MKTNEEYEKEFIDTAKEKTGHTVEEWMAILKSENPSKMKQALDWLKSEKEIGHMHATFIAAIYLNNGLPVYDSKVLFESHFQDNEDKRPIYHKIESLALAEFHNMQIVPTKGYISFRNDKEFAVVKVNKKQLRVGLDLADRPFDNYVQKAKNLGTMPRISHMVEVYEESEVNDKLKAKMIEANQIVNQKK